MLIAIVNQSTRMNNADAELMTAALQIQFDLQIAPAWNQKAPTVRFYADKTQVPGYAWVVNVLDDPNIANALGYHDEQSDKVEGFVFVSPVLDNGGVALYDPAKPSNVSVSSVCSHECAEIFGDRYASYWCDGLNVVASDGQTYSEYALELADPVQGDSYSVSVNGTNVSVSNFIFPAWTNQQAKAPDNMPFDYLKKLTAPFSMTSGGYMIVRQAGNVQQVFGEAMPSWQKELKMQEFSRASRRGK